MNNTSVDSYLAEGCGRCDRFQTPDCKVHQWTEALTELRALVRETELEETMKWGAPCYTLAGKNVLSVSALKDAAVIGFFKGAILEDAEGLLEAPGKNSRYVRTLKFSSPEDVRARREATARLIARAIDVERAGKSVNPPPAAEPVPKELQARLDAEPTLARAFEALTPGRRRSHILYVSGAKQAKTRVRRSERCAEKILAGKGFNER